MKIEMNTPQVYLKAALHNRECLLKDLEKLNEEIERLKSLVKDSK
jgi:prephenate dehydrogenase